MYLTNLKVESLEINTTIRNITFLKGLNLVVDSGKDQLTGSGNDIGKTTFLRAIDFCLGSAANELFEDRDEKKRNEEIKNFLINQKISFTLSIGYTFGNTDIILKRWFTGKINNKNNPVISQSINGTEEGIRNYTKILNKKIFGIEDKPSFRDLIPKFIREEKNSIGSLLRYLGNFKSDEEYNSIHLVLFGFKNTKLLDEKNQLFREKKEFENKRDVYINDYGKENILKSQISILEHETDELVKKRNILQAQLLDISNLETDLDNLNKLAKKISTLNGEIAKYEIDITNIEKNILRLEDEKAEVDLESIHILYSETKLYNETLQKDFSDLINFHNKMIINKINFSKKALESKKQKLQSLLDKRKNLIDSYQINKDVKENELFDQLNKLNDILIEKSNTLKILKNALDKIENSNKKLNNIQKRITEILEQIEKEKNNLQKNIDIFNKYFSKYTNELYNEEYFIFMGDDISKPFEINTKFNPGDGKKKAVITAFDLAYAAFLSESKLGYPKFIAEDQMELIDVKQLKKLFEISNTIDCQLIIPVLKSKISQIDGLEKHEILTLSEENKFFRF
jgi:hypothetical protein